MIVKPDVQFKELTAAAAGELVRFELGGASALAIVMRQTGHSTVCAFLRVKDESRSPFFWSISVENLVCLSYGNEWLLDLDHDASTFPGNGQYSDKHGVIHIGEDTVAINLDRPPGEITLSAGTFDLKTFKTVELRRRDCAPVTSWKIWHAAAAKHQANAKPLFVFAVS